MRERALTHTYLLVLHLANTHRPGREKGSTVLHVTDERYEKTGDTACQRDQKGCLSELAPLASDYPTDHNDSDDASLKDHHPNSEAAIWQPKDTQGRVENSKAHLTNTT